MNCYEFSWSESETDISIGLKLSRKQCHRWTFIDGRLSLRNSGDPAYHSFYAFIWLSCFEIEISSNQRKDRPRWKTTKTYSLGPLAVATNDDKGLWIAFLRLWESLNWRSGIPQWNIWIWCWKIRVEFLYDEKAAYVQNRPCPWWHFKTLS